MGIKPYSEGMTKIIPSDRNKDMLPPELIAEKEKPNREGLFIRLKRGLMKTKEHFDFEFTNLFSRKKIDDILFEELEGQLLIADVGVKTAKKIIESVIKGANRRQLNNSEMIYDLLKHQMLAILEKVNEPLRIKEKKPFVILIVGVNGVGKTTTIGKLAYQLIQKNKTVVLAAGDTFREAAIDQLKVWARRNNISVVARHMGADSAAVIFDAIQSARAKNIDVVIADTAGRLQNKSHLMLELKKILYVVKKIDIKAPHEIMLIIDATTGQNTINQATLFHEAIGLTGITVTKLDGTSKGGVIFSIADQFSIPIRYVGIGESIEDLYPFKSDDFVNALFPERTKNGTI